MTNRTEIRPSAVLPGATASLLRSAIVAAVLAAPWRAEATSPEPRALSGGGVAVFADGGAGEPLVSFAGLRLSYPGAKATVPFGAARSSRNALGLPVVETAPAAPGAGVPEGVAPPRVSARFEALGDRVAVRIRIEDSSADAPLKAGETTLLRRLAPGLAIRPAFRKTSRWARDPGGGQPHEEPLGPVAEFRADGAGEPAFRVVYAPGCGQNPAWRDTAGANLRFRREEDESLAAEFDIVPGGAEGAPDADALASRRAGFPMAASIRTDRVYHWFDDPGAPLEATLAAHAGGAEPRRVVLSHRVRDWDGALVSTGSVAAVVGPGAAWERRISFRAPPASGGRGLFFAEFSARDAASGEELAFCRTTLALLPPPARPFSSTPEDSIFGIAAYWPIPDEESVQRLMDRMGVRWVRQGDTRLQHPPRVANRHSSVHPHKWARDGRTDAERDAWIRTNLAACVENGNPYWEFCNELNMSTLGIAMEGGGIGKALQAPGYADWVRRIAEIKRERPEWERIGLLTLGIAGTDVAFLRATATNGVWGAFAGICEHPGRGNFTPDYPYLHPENPAARAPASDKVSPHSNFWNFLGAVRLTKESVARLDAEFTPDGPPKPLWLTEVYAPTPPNGAWEDTLRNSADNALLTWLLARAEGVKAAMWYQLFDSVWHDRLGARPTDREYFFGLVARDLSFKPALMAYCTAAEALDGAAFRGWIDMSALGAPETAHGMLFDGPDGPFAAVWDRADGYVLSDLRAKPYRAPDPWVDPWPTKTPVPLPAAPGASVRAVDAIGRSRPVPAAPGPDGPAATVPLDGAARLVYGLDPARLPLVSPR